MMAQSPVQHVVDQVRRAAAMEQTSDAALLDAFVGEHSDSAFAELVRRHGPMVWGVCCRLLPHRQDTEDCYQATFLVLVRKADTVRPRSRVGAWLHGVAYHTALKARHLAAKRGRMEQQVGRLPEPIPQPDTTAELRQLLDCGLSELPEKYRTAIILCELEGRTIKDVAQELGCPIGTLAGWLARGRDLLARRLVKHGAPVGAAALTAVLAEKASSAPPTLALVSASASVVALADATVRSLFLAKLKTWLIATAALLVIGLGLGGTLFHALANDPPPQQRIENPIVVPRDRLAKDEPAKTPALRFGWQPGEAYVYTVRVEVELAPGTVVLTSHNKYGVASYSEAFAQRQRDKLLARATTADGKAACLTLQSRLSNSVGNKFKRGDPDPSQVPLALANLSLLTVLPDNPTDPTWQTQADCALPVSKGIPGPAGRAGNQAEETSVFTVGKPTGALVVIDKKYDLKNKPANDGPAFEFHGTAAITFDVSAGLIQSMEAKGVMQQAGREISIRVTYRLLEGAERMEKLKAIEDAQPKSEASQ